MVFWFAKEKQCRHRKWIKEGRIVEYFYQGTVVTQLLSIDEWRKRQALLVEEGNKQAGTAGPRGSGI
jgi:hypothetical protein